MSYQRTRMIALLSSSLLGAVIVSHVALIGGVNYFISEQAILVSIGMVFLFGRLVDIEKPGAFEVMVYFAMAFSPFLYRLWEVSSGTGSILAGLAWAGRDLGSASFHLVFLAALGVNAGLSARKLSGPKMPDVTASNPR